MRGLALLGFALCSLLCGASVVAFLSSALVAPALVQPAEAAVGGQGSGEGSDPRLADSNYEFDPQDVRVRHQDGYDILEFPGSVADMERSRLGQPQLPVIIKWFAIPRDTRVARVDVQASDWTELPGSLIPPPIGWEEEPDQDRDNEYYESDRPFPPRQGFASRSTEYRGYYMAQVVVYPVKWDPQTGSASLARDVRISIQTQPLNGEEAVSVPRVRRPEGADPHGETRRFLLGQVENRAEMAEFYPWTERGTRTEQEHRAVESTPYGAVPTTWPSTEGPTVERVIIYDNQTLSGEPIGDVGDQVIQYALFNWYHEGQVTVVVKLSDILAQYGTGADVPEVLRHFALDCYELWRTSSILLVGDLDVIPARRFGGPTSTDGMFRMDPPSDVYITTFSRNDTTGVYAVADWNANDDTWEWEDAADRGTLPAFESQPPIAVGRLPVRTAADAEAMFRKLMEYRQPDRFGKVAPPSSYYRDVLGVAGMTNSGGWNTGFVYVEDVIDAVRNAALPDSMNIHRLYAEVPHDSLPCGESVVPCYPTIADSLASRWQDTDEVWSGTGLFDNIDEGFHFVFHIEHSDPDRWGRPTKFPPSESPCDTSSAAWRDACYALFSYSSVQPLTLATVRSLSNGLIYDGGQGGVTPRYSIMATHGSWTNALDRGTIAEELLATPDGGAVAYLGKIMSINSSPDMAPAFFGMLVAGDAAGPPTIGVAAAWAAASGSNQTYLGFARTATGRPLLGDPGMRVFAAAPEPLELVLPNAVGLGPQTISVTVRGATSLDPVEGAIVTALQDSVAYATAVTNASGVAVFEAFTVRRDSGIRVNAAHRNYYSGVDTLDVSPAAPYLTYDHHILDDGAPGGDGDGVLEAGEIASLRVVWRNEGSATATAPVLSLRPSPSVEFHLQINGEYRPAEIYIGAKNGTPPNTVTESFRLPVSWEGVSVHGEPNAVSLEESFKVWRKHDTGEYVISAHSPSAQTDSVFTGILRTNGSFSDVTMTGEGGDTFFASADSIWFQFHGDASADYLTFRAEAVDWVSVTANAIGLVSGVAVGDTVSRSFDLAWTGEVPDMTVLPFTATAKQNGTVYAHGELAFEVHAPDLELWVLDDVATTASGCGVARAFFPTLWNGGTAEADSVVVHARVISGSATLSDSVASFGRLDPDGFAIFADSIVVCAADSTSLANSILDLDIEVILRNENSEWYDPGEFGGGGGTDDPPVTDPGEFIAEPRGRGIFLRWDPVETVHGEPVTRYVVFVRTESSGSDSLYPVGQVFGASRLEVLDVAGERLESVDENGDPIEYQFAVRACAGARCALPSVLSITNQSNFTQHEGWPKSVPSGLTTAPLTIELDGREAVFVAGREIYGWWLDDGTPVRGAVGGKPEGFFYDPELPVEASTLFAETLVELPLTVDGDRVGTAIVGNVIRDAVYAIELVGPSSGNYSPNPIWKKNIRAWSTAPMVIELNAVDLDNEFQVAIHGVSDTLYVWMDDGTPYLEAYTANPGAYARFDAGGPSHRTLAEWYYPYPFNDPVKHYIVQSMRNGEVVQWDTPSRSSTSLATPRWQQSVEQSDGTRFVLSAPSVGDVDGDGVAEVVVTDHVKRLQTTQAPPDCGGEPCGEVWVLDGSNGDIKAYAQNDDWLFESEGRGEPPSRPVLAGLDPQTPNQLEILVGAWNWANGAFGTNYQLVPLRVSSGDLETIGSHAPATTGHRYGSAGTLVRREGIVGDIGDEGNMEALFSGFEGEVVGVEWLNPGGSLPDSVAAKTGWPMWIGDEPFTPCLVSGDEAGVLIASRDKRLHFLRIPGVSWGSDGWPQYGRNSRNTASHVPPAFSPRESHSADLITLRVAPVPNRGEQRIEFGLSRAGAVDLAVYDVVGRRIRVLLDGALLESGRHGVVWDGRNDRGYPVASGVYFHRVNSPDGTYIARTVVRR